MRIGEWNLHAKPLPRTRSSSARRPGHPFAASTPALPKETPKEVTPQKGRRTGCGKGAQPGWFGSAR